MQALGTDEAEGSWLGQMQAESPAADVGEVPERRNPTRSGTNIRQ